MSQGTERRDQAPSILLKDMLMAQEEGEVAVMPPVRWGGGIRNNPSQLSVPVPSDTVSSIQSHCQVGKVLAQTAGSQLHRDLARPRRALIFLPPKPCTVPHHDEMLFFNSLTYSNGPMAYLGFLVVTLSVLSAQKHKSEVLGTPTYM